MNTVRIFNDKEVDELFLLDIDGTRTGSVLPVELVAQIAEECYMPFGIGGGIRSVSRCVTC